ncbi:MAG: hypothetical protein QM669_07365 [Siphonobacter sp.]
MERELDDILHCPCPGCGAQLQYDAQKQAMTCLHCGYTEKLDFSKDRIEELGWSYAQADKAASNPHSVERHLFSVNNAELKRLSITILPP